MTAHVDHVNDYSRTDQITLWFSQHWIVTMNILLGTFAILPFMAPVFMSTGWVVPGKLIYFFYSFLCHQLPERSYFLMGPKISYSLKEIQIVWQNTNDVTILRQFLGNPQMGWKVAWSDRMVSMFTSLWLFGILWEVIRKKVKPLPWWGLILLIMPLALDGTTHLISDLTGFGQGFRDTNAWLAMLTNHIFPAAFYAGDAWGSFNAWMRLISGVIFSLGIAWFLFPHMDEAFINSIEMVRYKYKYRKWLEYEKERRALLSSSEKESKLMFR
jgi:uncharacterized membrane protein